MKAKMPAATITMLALAATACGLPRDHFAWHPDADAVRVEPGGTGSVDLVIESKRNIGAKVFLRLEDVPEVPGVTTGMEDVLPGTDDRATLTFSTSLATPEGEFEYDVVAREEGGSERSDSVVLKVAKVTGDPDFALSLDPASVTLKAAGDEATIRIWTRSLNRFEGTLRFRVSGRTDALEIDHEIWDAEIEAASRDGAWEFTLTLAPGQEFESHVELTVTAEGSSGGPWISHSATLRVAIEPAHQPARTVTPDTRNQRPATPRR